MKFVRNSRIRRVQLGCTVARRFLSKKLVYEVSLVYEACTRLIRPTVCSAVLVVTRQVPHFHVWNLRENSKQTIEIVAVWPGRFGTKASLLEAVVWAVMFGETVT